MKKTTRIKHDALDIIKEQTDDNILSNFASKSNNIIIDVGMNNGLDTAHFLNDGYSVISIDASPKWITKAKKRFKTAIAENRLILLNVGLANETGSLDFYDAASDTRSSFDRFKASKYGHVKINRVSKVDVVPCETLLSLINKRIFFMKIDIEEYDFHCVEGISRRIKENKLRPLFVSWENHFRRGKPDYDSFPAFDMNLILSMASAGYNKIKMSFGAGGTYFGDNYPDDIQDCLTGSTKWRSLKEFVSDGIRCDINKSSVSYYDFHMTY